MEKLFYFRKRIVSVLVEKISVFSLLIIASFCFHSECKGQASNDKIVVGVAPFTSSENCCTNPSYVGQIQECVITAIQNAKRFTLVERTAMNSLYTEEELNKGEDFMNSTAIEQGKKIGAKFLLLGNVASARADSVVINGTKSFKGDILFSIRLVNVETGEIKEAVTISPNTTKASFFDRAASGINLNALVKDKNDTSNVSSAINLNAALVAATPNEAFRKVLMKVEKHINEELIAKIPVTFKIVEVVEASKDGSPQQIMIYAGSSKGIKAKDDLEVIEITRKTFEGNTSFIQTTICKLKVEEVKGSDFSICSVDNKNASLLRDKMRTKANIHVVPAQPK